MLAGLRAAATERVRRWARRRQGPDTLPVTLGRRRVYILPTRFGVIYAAIVFTMLLASMNYNNSLGFALTFLLTGLGLVAMHHCHHTLRGLVIAGVQPGEAFAGGAANLQVGLQNPGASMRFEIRIDVGEQREHEQTNLTPRIDAASSVLAGVPLPVGKRGVLRLDRIAVSTRFPFGLFRAWSWVHLPVEVVVYPKPTGTEHSPATADEHADYSSRQQQRDGSEDFRGFRDYVQGDSPRRIHWKALARGAPLLVKEYAAASQAPTVFDFDAVRVRDTEARLSQLCRWIVDAEQKGAVYGLKLPGRHIPLASGAAHRRRCLTALALFGQSFGNPRVDASPGRG